DPTGLPRQIAFDLCSDPSSPLAPTLQLLLTKMYARSEQAFTGKHRFTDALYRQIKKGRLHLDDFLTEQLKALEEPPLDAMWSWKNARPWLAHQSLFDDNGRQQVRQQWVKEVIDTGFALDFLGSFVAANDTAGQRALTDLQSDYPHQADSIPLLVERCKD